MPLSNDLRMFARFANGLRDYYREPIDPACCFSALQAQVKQREDRFLQTLERAVFQHPKSPYLRLLDWAGVELGDLRKLVLADGVDAALAKLRDAGIYVGIEEFKGRRPIKRSGLELVVEAADFDSPVLRRPIEALTGGSGGVPRLILLDLDQITEDALSYGAFLEMFALAHRPSAIWRPVLPGAAATRKALMLTRLGSPLERWFSQQPSRLTSGAAKACLMTSFIVRGSRFFGGSIPKPEWTPLEEAERVARWAHECVKRGTPPLIDTMVSGGVRVCLAGRELGLDLSGTFFRFGSEPYTAPKAKVISDAGCDATQFYAITECGHVGIGCGAPSAPDDVHVLLGKMAAIEAARPPEAADGLCFYLTTLIPHAPKIMINVESGDHGVLDSRSCGCPLDRCGHSLHIRNLQSYEKLTAGGMHFLADDLTRLIEQVLPSRFGGGPTDYQFVEDHRGELPQVKIIVSPRVGAVNNQAVVAAALGALGAKSPADQMMASQLKQGAVFQIERREPHVTVASKVPVLHVIRTGDGRRKPA